MHFCSRNSLDLVSRQAIQLHKGRQRHRGHVPQNRTWPICHVTYEARRDPHGIVSHLYGSSSLIDYKRYATLRGFAPANVEEDIGTDNGMRCVK